jgi:hypothetical protein
MPPTSINCFSPTALTFQRPLVRDMAHWQLGRWVLWSGPWRGPLVGQQGKPATPLGDAASLPNY